MRAFIGMISLLATIGMVVGLLLLGFFIRNLSSNLDVKSTNPGNALMIPPPAKNTN